MELKNEIFAYVLNWLIDNNKVRDQKGLAQLTGIGQNTITRIMKNRGEPKDETLIKLNAAFNNIFNMDYLRGKSCVMLAEDVEYYRAHPSNLRTVSGNPSDYTLIGHKESQPAPTRTIDESSIINAMIAAHNAAIESLKREVAAHLDTIAAKNSVIAAKEATIKDKDSLLAAKDSIIKDKDSIILSLRQQLSAASSSLSSYPFPFGAADDKKADHLHP